MSALAFSASRVDNPGGVRLALVTVTPSSSYPSGGEAFTAADAGMKRILGVLNGTSATGETWVWTGSKLKALWVDTTVDGAALAEVTPTTDLSAKPVTLLVFGVD